MPNSIPRGEGRENGYTSSSDDEPFSDAPEGLPAAATDKSTPTSKAAMDNAIAIPGAFGSDDTDDELDGAVTAIGTPKPVVSRPTTPMRGEVIEVKWNEQTDIISPKVRGEHQRIEKLVHEQGERSRNPSTSPAPVGVRKTSSLFSAEGETEQQLESVAVDDGEKKDDEPVEAVEDVDVEAAAEPARKSPSPVEVEESQVLPDITTVTEDDDDATPVAEKPESAAATENNTEEKEDVTEEKTEDVTEEKTAVVTEEKTEDVTEEKTEDVPEEKTEDVTEEKTEDVTEEKTEDVTEEKTEAVTEGQTEDVAEEKTEDVTEAEKEDILAGKAEGAVEEKEDDGFGRDDFDGFGEAVEADGDDFNDFEDFEGFEDGDADGILDEPALVLEAAPSPPPPPSQPVVPQLPVPLPDFGDAEGIRFALAGAVEKMFPKEGAEQRKPTAVEGRSFLTDRSQSLWNQLVAPPPLQPPNWKISRIRRLFLVSLGIPMDLDEVLPPETKQKKLVLPSVHLSRHPKSRSSSRNSRRSGSLSRKKKGAEDKNQINPESLDIPSARILCSTSTIALRNLTVEELRAHVQKLEETTAVASEVLTYWLAKRDGAIGDKETFETVIESLVGYARKKRQNG